MFPKVCHASALPSPAGFIYPVLPKPIGPSRGVNIVPASRPMLRFDGNTAHSSGYMWWGGRGRHSGRPVVALALRRAASPAPYKCCHAVPAGPCRRQRPPLMPRPPPPAHPAAAGSRPAACTLGACCTKTPSRATGCTTTAAATSSPPCEGRRPRCCRGRPLPWQCCCGGLLTLLVGPCLGCAAARQRA